MIKLLCLKICESCEVTRTRWVGIPEREGLSWGEWSFCLLAAFTDSGFGLRVRLGPSRGSLTEGKRNAARLLVARWGWCKRLEAWRVSSTCCKLNSSITCSPREVCTSKPSADNVLAAVRTSVWDLKGDLGGATTASPVLNGTCWVLGLCERLGS